MTPTKREYPKISIISLFFFLIILISIAWFQKAPIFHGKNLRSSLHFYSTARKGSAWGNTEGTSKISVESEQKEEVRSEISHKEERRPKISKVYTLLKLNTFLFRVRFNLRTACLGYTGFGSMSELWWNHYICSPSRPARKEIPRRN